MFTNQHVAIFLISYHACHGFWIGWREWELGRTIYPYSNLFHRTLSHASWGCVEAFFFPFSLPLFIADLFMDDPFTRALL